jgi:hypothetical protein
MVIVRALGDRELRKIGSTRIADLRPSTGDHPRPALFAKMASRWSTLAPYVEGPAAPCAAGLCR